MGGTCPQCPTIHSTPGRRLRAAAGSADVSDMDAPLDGLPVRADGLITSADATAMGCRHRLHRLHRTGALQRVWPGVYAAAPTAAQTGQREAAARYLQRVRAAAHQMPGQVFTSYSAAVLLGLPIVGRWPQQVYVLARSPNGSRRAGVRSVGHRGPIPATTVDGIRVTVPAHTVIQIAREAPLAAALVAADAALRHPPYAKRPPLLTLADLHSTDERLRPYRGQVPVAAVLQRATPLADSPLESISRLVIEELGFAAPQLQHRIWLPGLGEYVWVDFYWPELGIAMEADGHGKYLDAGSATGAAERVVHEKRREDELRGQVHHFGRWGWDEAWKVYPLERKLERAGVPRTRPRRHLFVS